MFDRWNELERTFAAMDELRRRVEQAWGFEDDGPDPREVRGLQMNLKDEGDRFVLRAELPGMKEQELELLLTQDVLTVKGERKLAAPEGYSVHRQERRPFKFARSFTLPARVDGEKIAASLKDGLLVVSMPKAAESQPRQIAVKAS